jgi:hypothetical protein
MKNNLKKRVQQKKKDQNIEIINRVIFREYNTIYKVHIFIDDTNINNIIPINNELIFYVCEKTTIKSILKFCFDIVRPNETTTENFKVKILWKLFDTMGFDTFWSGDFKKKMTLELLDYYYDAMYTKNNFIFLQIL